MSTDDDLIPVPRGLLGAACSAIDGKRTAPATLERLRTLAMAMIPQEERLRAENRDLKLAVSALILTAGRVVVTRDVLDRAPGVSIRRTDHPSGDIVFQVEESANG